MESASQRGTFILKSFTIGLLFAAGLVVSHADHGEDYYAKCIIQPLGLPGMNISGTITLHQSGSTHQITVEGHLYGFENITNTKRGFHVHEFGSLDNNCTAARAHYNPFNVSHGGPNDNIRHVGDLGNIIVNNTNLESMINITDSVISLHGNNSIVNRSLVVHASEDDLGTGAPSSDTKTTGNSGGRIGCCVITLYQPMPTVAPPSNSTTSAMSSATSMETFTGITLLCVAGLQLLIKSMQ